MIEQNIYWCLHIILALTEVGLCWKLLLCIVLNEKYLKRKDKIIIMVSSLLLAIIIAQNRQIVFFSSALYFLCIVVHGVCAVAIKREKVILIGSVILAFYSFQTLLDFIFAFVSICFLENNFFEIVFSYSHSLWQIAIFSCSRILIMGLIIVLRRKVKEEAGFEDIIWILTGWGIILFALVLVYQRVLVEMLNGTRSYAGKEMGISLLVIIGIFGTVTILILNNRRVYDENRYLFMREELILEKYQQLEEEMERNRCIVHDIRHDTLALYEYAKNGDYSKLKTYLENMMDELPISKKEVWTQNSLWDLIIQQKKEVAKEMGIQVEINTELISGFPFTEREGCAIFGNLLDNAIEACQNNAGINKRISVRVTRKNAMLFLKVGNSIESKPRMRSGKFITSKKGDIHGYGLKSVERIVKKHEGVIAYDISDGWFSVSITFFDGIK